MKITDHQAKRHHSALTGKTQTLYTAKITTPAGTLHVSRFPNEAAYLVDASFLANGIPNYVHGEGSRCCLKRQVADPVNQQLRELEDELTLPKVEDTSLPTTEAR
jgi:hypothetical protein